MSETVYHIPALLPQCLDALDIHPGGVYVDCTFGGGGHSRAILERLDAAQGGHLYGFDQDRDALANAPRDPRFTMVLSNFRYLVNFMRYYNVESVDGVLADRYYTAGKAAYGRENQVVGYVIASSSAAG